VKRTVVAFISVAVLSGFPGFVVAQNKEASAPREHKVGLIDMAYLFTNYDKFKDMREALKGDMTEIEAGIKGDLDKLKGMAEQLKTFAAGSDDQIAYEKKITAAQAKIEADKQNASRELFRQESKIYQSVYTEVTEAVSLYAQARHYTLILRFTRGEESIGEDPKKVMQALQRQVVYSQPEDDITDRVLKYLNSEYGKVRPVSGTVPKTKPRTTVE